MRKENLLLRHWESEVVLFQQNLSNYNGSNPELIHQIRISIKKLRSYLQLYFLIGKKKDAKLLFKETEDLFSLLGKHRDIENNKLKVNNIAGNDAALARSYFAWLQALQNELDSISQSLSHYHLSGLKQLTINIKSTVENSEKEKLAGQVSAVQHHVIQKVKRLLAHFRRHAHQVRKYLKNLYYWSKIPLLKIELSKKAFHQLEQTLDILGDWQDEEVTLRFIRQFHNKVINTQQTNTLKRAEKMIEVQKAELLKKAHQRTQKFLRLI